MKAAALVLLPGLCLPPGLLHAQETDRAIAARLGPEVTSRLRSADPAVVAWGASLAGRFGVMEGLPDLREVLGRTPAEEPLALYVLDALVRLDAKLDSEEVEPFLEGPTLAPALVLLARDVETHGELLLDLYRTHAGQGEYLVWLGTGSLLSWARTPGFAAHLLDGFTFTLSVTVVDRRPDMTAMGPGAAGAAIRSRSRRLPAGYPPLPRYRFVTEASPGDVVLAPGPEPVFWRRSEDPERIWSVDAGGGFAWETAHTEYRWLRSMAGLDTTPTRCLVARFLRVVYAGPADYRQRVEAECDGLHEEFRRLLRGLRGRRAITEENADAARLDLRLRIEDDRRDRSQPLPDIDTGDPGRG